MVIYNSIYTAPLPNPGNLTEIIFNTKHRNFNRVPYINGITGESISFENLKALRDRISFILKNKYGISNNDVVGIFSPNHYLLAAIHHGVISLGATVAPLASSYTPKEVLHSMHIADVKLIIVDSDLVNVVKEAVNINNNAKNNAKKIFVKNSPECIVTIDELIKQAYTKGPSLKPINVSEKEFYEKAAYLCFSSGTTGDFKAVKLTHSNLAANVLQIYYSYPKSFDSNSIHSSFLPMSHVYGLNIFLNTCLYGGATCVVMPRFDLKNMLDQIVKYKVTNIFLVPPVLVLLAKHPLIDNYKDQLIKSLRQLNSGAAPLSSSLAIAVQNRLPGVTVTQGYGLTETSPTTHGSFIQREVSKIGSAGRLLPNIEARIVDENLNDVPNEFIKTPDYPIPVIGPGELLLRGQNIMAGYYKNKEATSNAILPGKWFRTGDVAILDQDGYYYIVDRVKELIKSKGHQVAPAELEALLLRHEDVLDSAVIGIFEEKIASELPRAFVVVKPNSKAASNPAIISEWLNSQVARHKRLWGGLVVIDQIPKSPSGKILRRFLKQRKNDVVYGVPNTSRL